MNGQPTQDAGQRRSPPTEAELTTRRERLIELRNAGAPWSKIAAELGYDSPASAATDMRRALDHRREQLNLTIDQYRESQLAAIAERRKVLTDIRDTVHYVVQGGEIVVGQNGEPMVDDGPVAAAVKALREEDIREARLLGLDSAVKVSHSGTVNYTIDGISPEALT